jgi:hypothetical protein
MPDFISTGSDLCKAWATTSICVPLSTILVALCLQACDPPGTDSKDVQKNDPEAVAIGRYRGEMLGFTGTLDLRRQGKADMLLEGLVNHDVEGRWTIAGDAITTMFPGLLGGNEVRHWRVSPLGLEDLDHGAFNMQRLSESK